MSQTEPRSTQGSQDPSRVAKADAEAHLALADTVIYSTTAHELVGMLTRYASKIEQSSKLPESINYLSTSRACNPEQQRVFANLSNRLGTGETGKEEFLAWVNEEKAKDSDWTVITKKDAGTAKPAGESR